MTGSAGRTTRAFAYLILRSWRNRVLAMASRVRKPRYALGLLAGAAYLVVFIWGNHAGARTGARSPFQGETVRTIAPLIVALILIPSWFLGRASQALAFTMSEVSLLFPAPVSRRALILYKLAGAQAPIVINALLFVFVFRIGSSALPHGAALLSMWTLFATVYLHRLGAGLVRASTLAHGRSAAKRHWASHAFAIAVPAVIVGAIAGGAGELRDASGASGFGQTLVRLLSQPAPHAALVPFALIAAPAFATSVDAWVGPMAIATGVLALHVVWVLRSTAAFEEAAAEASQRRQAMLESLRRRGTVRQPSERPTRTRRTLPLAATGAPLMAIIWKNILGLWRTLGTGSALALIVAPVALGGIAASQFHDPGVIVAMVCGLAALLFAVTGSIGARNDLRADLLNLSLLKTMPLRGSEIVQAEVASSALPMAALQYILLLVGLVGLQASRHPAPADIAVALAATLPFALAAINLAFSTLRNGAAVLFPAWTHLGSESTQGIEVMGQAILGVLGALVALALLLVAPTVIAIVVAVMAHLSGGAAVAAGLVVGGVALAGECYAIMLGIGRALDRLEPSHVG